MNFESMSMNNDPLGRTSTDAISRFVRLVNRLSAADVILLLEGLEKLSGIENFKSIHHTAPEVIGGRRKLTAREQEIIILLANGYTRRDISNALGIAVHTAASHIQHIYRKLEISSIAEATQYAIRNDLLKSISEYSDSNCA